MKKIGAILFLVVFLLANFQDATTIGLFYLNQSYLASEFCVNKETPVMQCNGKCHLASTLQSQADETDENTPQIEVQRLVLTAYMVTFEMPEIRPQFYPKNSRSKVLKPQLFPHSIFHPPEFTEST